MGDEPYLTGDTLLGVYQVRVETSVPAPAQRIWVALTQPEQLAVWFWPWHAVVSLSPTVGADYSIEAIHPRIGRLAAHGTILAVQPPRFLALTWSWTDEAGPATSVEISIDEQPDTTIVAVCHGDIETEKTAVDYRHAWTDLLARLRAFLVGT